MAYKINKDRLPYTGFLIYTILLSVIGLLMLYSASTVESYNNFGNTHYYFVHQLIYGFGFGLLALLITSKINYQVWKQFIPLALIVACVLLFAVKIPGIGFSANGATRWIHVGPIFFQPSEIAKLALILYFSGWISTKHKQLNDFWSGVVPPILVTLVFAALIITQPDAGTMMSMVLSVTIMLFAANLNLKYFITLVTLGFFSLLALIKYEPYRAKRLITFLNPSLDPLGIGYQINQSLLAIGAGGLWGYGYGLSRQKHNYLPESFTDSIFAVVSEELGLIRVLIILLLFALFTWGGFKIAKNAPDIFSKMLAIGIISGIAIQVIINIGSILGLLPLTGIPLPFFSYGSSAMVVTLAEIGIILNIAKQSK